MLSIRITATPAILERLHKGPEEILARLRDRMNISMFKLHARVVEETIPEMFPNGAPNIAGTVRAIPAETSGMVIHGEVDAGGPKTTKRTLRSGVVVDYAAVQHEGIDHSYQILPFNKRALSFIFNGNRAIFRSVTHPPLAARPYMKEALNRSAAEIEAAFQAEVNEFFGTP